MEITPILSNSLLFHALNTVVLKYDWREIDELISLIDEIERSKKTDRYLLYELIYFCLAQIKSRDEIHYFCAVVDGMSLKERRCMIEDIRKTITTKTTIDI